MFDWHVNHSSMFLSDNFTIPLIICSSYYHHLKFICLPLKLCKLLKTHKSKKFLTLISIYTVNEHVGSVKWDNRAKKTICGETNAGKLCEPWQSSVAYLPCIPLPSLLTGRPGLGRSFSPVTRIAINGKIWLQPCMTSRHTLGKFFKLTLTTAPEPPPRGSPTVTASSQLESGARVSKGEFWYCEYCLCGQDTKTALGQPTEFHIYARSVFCQVDVCLEWGGCDCSPNTLSRSLLS